MNRREKLVKGPVVLYEQMRTKIIELIRERNLRPHDPIPSEAELAAMYGVSTRTSKEALAALAKEGLVYRLPRRGTFLAERPGAPQRSNPLPIALVVPDMDEYAGAIVQSAVGAARQAGAEVLLRVTGGDLTEEERTLKQAAAEARGIILFPGNRRTCPDELLRLHLAQFPIVIVDRAYREIGLPSVYHDHYQGGYELTDYLIEAGHRQIGFITADIEGVMSREDRYYGYMQALLNNRIPFEGSMVLTLPGPGDGFGNRSVPALDEAGTAAALERFLQAHPRMTAVFCANDELAGQTMAACFRLGVKVPLQLSVAGFTDSSLARRLPVPLTTMRKPADTLGEAAVRLLLERIDNPSVSPPPSVKYPTQLIVRDSVRTLISPS
ncbi:GntR family transcriptional regulator [Cohnella ginsengisoli]|uniref:GntR family transcriptional regulator n=1 Tax=Cohnella ginsengisoli TaxID=425004 RepID=A0A9X4KLZ5_9BACL|nr:GntR family transcriptional regulator [Cohnella ginsengisoli]MDG0794176.1 GntR family transcriptional regulator [Cohnella ginsengisoli]